MRTEFLCASVLRVASGPRVKLASCKSAFGCAYMPDDMLSHNMANIQVS